MILTGFRGSISLEKYVSINQESYLVGKFRKSIFKFTHIFVLKIQKTAGNKIGRNSHKKYRIQFLVRANTCLHKCMFAVVA